MQTRLIEQALANEVKIVWHNALDKNWKRMAEQAR